MNYNMYPSMEKTEAGTQPFKKLTIIVEEPGLTTAQSLKKCIWLENARWDHSS